MLQSIVSGRHELGAALSTGTSGAELLSGGAGASPGAQDLRYSETGIPAFFDHAPTLTLRDPLAAYLGAARDGIMTYRYLHAVQLAGHSCPVVASAYLIALNGLRRLYGDELPVRGDIQIQLRDDRAQGTTGVTASVLTLITGAAEDAGFSGLGPGKRFSRRQLLSYGASNVDGFVLLRRRDTGQAVQASYHLEAVPADPDLATLLPAAIAGTLDAADQPRFAALFQDRVRRMLIQHATDLDLIRLQDA